MANPARRLTVRQLPAAIRAGLGLQGAWIVQPDAGHYVVHGSQFGVCANEIGYLFPKLGVASIDHGWAGVLW